MGEEVSRGREDELLDAIRSGRIKRVHELLRQGLDPNTIDARGVSCLSRAILQRNCEMVRLLLIAGANPNAHVVTQNQSPSMLLSMRVDDRKIAQLLINAGCNIQNLNMQMAARLGCCHGFKSFLERGLDVNNQDTTGRTMLHAAVTADKPNVVDLLIRWSANVNIRDKFSQTPVCTAIVLNYVDCLDILLANGAQMRAINRRKDSALKVASKLMTRKSVLKMDTVDCVIRHLAILESQGPFVEPDDYELIEQLPLAVRDYLNICRNELKDTRKGLIFPAKNSRSIETIGHD
ncbi:hypothetical protein QAD02_000363 [Eretmocerus hayati]|uniref:Uncharacterized protein n=1 Tax=Eretmocerus hayati TaxID=131215 RepID=A0ACC2NDH3_9HYME|nr:hypothetical protein QAD02_000363 [Eretmocerus hayati]